MTQGASHTADSDASSSRRAKRGAQASSAATGTTQSPPSVKTASSEGPPPTKKRFPAPPSASDIRSAAEKAQNPQKTADPVPVRTVPQKNTDPIPVRTVPLTADDAINNFVCDELTKPGSQKLPDDPTLDILDRLIDCIVTGADVAEIKEEVTRLVSHPREKAEIISAVLRNHEYRRFNQWLRVRAQSEELIFRAMKRGELSTTEALAFMRAANAEINQFTATLAKQEDKTGDPASLLEKVDIGKAAREAEFADTYKGTTPHGREIIRRRVFALRRQMKERSKVNSKIIEVTED